MADREELARTVRTLEETAAKLRKQIAEIDCNELYYIRVREDTPVGYVNLFRGSNFIDLFTKEQDNSNQTQFTLDEIAEIKKKNNWINWEVAKLERVNK